jgi:hypothetical protein
LLQVLAEADDIGSTCTTTMSTVNKPCDTTVAHTLHVVVADDSSDAAGVVAEEQQLMQTPVAGTDITACIVVLLAGWTYRRCKLCKSTDVIQPLVTCIFYSIGLLLSQAGECGVLLSAGKLQEAATFLTPRSSFSADRSRNK